ncbi:MAG: hypothetical protein ACO2OQ_04150 [Thermofilaceae archaeon]
MVRWKVLRNRASANSSSPSTLRPSSLYSVLQSLSCSSRRGSNP